jgi:hypothetical protein
MGLVILFTSSRLAADAGEIRGGLRGAGGEVGAGEAINEVGRRRRWRGSVA